MNNGAIKLEDDKERESYVSDLYQQENNRFFHDIQCIQKAKHQYSYWNHVSHDVQTVMFLIPHYGIFCHSFIFVW